MRILLDNWNPNSSYRLYKAGLCSVRESESKLVASSSNGGQLIALSVKQSLGLKRAYLEDFESWSDYFKVRNMILKAALIVLEPCTKALQQISDHIQELDKEEAQGIYRDEDLSLEHEWMKRWSVTYGAIKDNAIKLLSIDFLRKSFEHLARSLCSERTTDRLTKAVGKSATRKVAKYSTGRLWFGLGDRAYISAMLLKTSAYSFALGRLAAFTFEVLKVNYDLLRKSGLASYMELSKKKFRRMVSFTLRRGAYYTINWGCYTVCVSLCTGFDYKWPLANDFGLSLGFVFGDLMTDGLANLFDGFVK